MTWPFQPLLPGAAQQQASATSRTLAADAGSFDLAGQTGVPRVTARLSAAGGVLGVNGQAANLRHAFTLTADADGVVLTGEPVGVLRALRLNAGQGAILLSGQDTGAASGSSVSAEAASFALAGETAGLRASRRLNAARGAFALAGVAALPSGASEPIAATPLDLGLSIGL